MPPSLWFSKGLLPHSCHSYLLMSPFENFPFPGTVADVRGYLWFSKRKSVFQRTHSKTGWAPVNIRLWFQVVQLCHRKGLGCKSSTFSSELPCKRQSFRISFTAQFVSIKLRLWWCGFRICSSKTGQSGYGKRYFHSSKAEKHFFIFSEWIQLKEITAAMIAFGSLVFDL